MYEEAFAALVKHAESHGLRIFFHSEEGMPFLLVRERREIYMSSALPYQRRLFLLEKALSQVSIPRAPTRPTSASGARINASLVESLVGDCDSTLKDVASHSHSQLGRRVHETPPPLGPIGADRCEVCGGPPYGFVKGLTFCRYHLSKSVIGALEPAEVMALRRRYGQHPEISSERYDERGFSRS